MQAYKGTREATESHKARHTHTHKKKSETQMQVHTQAARLTQTVKKHTVTLPFSLRQTEPGSAEA